MDDDEFNENVEKEDKGEMTTFGYETEVVKRKLMKLKLLPTPELLWIATNYGIKTDETREGLIERLWAMDTITYKQLLFAIDSYDKHLQVKK